ncbi:MAG: M48 family metallopeptidase [Methylococcales bacterium]
MNFFARQEHAKKKTRLLVLYLIVAVLCIVITLNALVYLYMVGIQNHSYSLSEWLVEPKSLLVTGVTIFTITIISFTQWRLLREGGDALALRMGATPVGLDTSDSRERQLLNVVEEMAIASGIAMPTVYVMERERGINAFVAGLNQSDAILVVTHGAIRELTRQELQGVIGHEFSHIFHADMGINLKLISLLAGILFLSEAGRFVLSSTFDSQYSYTSRRHRGNGNPFVFLLPMGIVLFAVGSIGLFFARIIKSSISRQREYLADAAAVQYTRDNQGLASALYKISDFSDGSTLHSPYAEEASHMCFSESVSMFSGFLSGLLSTHPPIDQRIKAICPGWNPGRVPRVNRAGRHQTPTQHSNAVPDSVMALTGNNQTRLHLTQTIGQPTAQHLQEAQRIIQSIPASLRITAATADTKAHSFQLVIALLVADDGQQTNQALENIKPVYGSDFSQSVRELAAQIQQQPRKQRLAIFDLAIPALKGITRPERKTLFEVLRKIIQLDHTVSRFEYTLYWLLKKHLYGQTKQAKLSTNSLKIVPNEVAIVIAMMIEASGENEASRRKAFSFIMTNLGLSQMLMPVTEFDADVIHKAVMVLAQLNPIPKQSLLYALEDCVTEDKIVAPEEAELLRTIAELMDCPIPPLLALGVSRA